MPFQSTPPAKAATVLILERQWSFADVSIHAAREGGDERTPLSGSIKVFQSTPPAKAATGQLRSP